MICETCGKDIKPPDIVEEWSPSRKVYHVGCYYELEMFSEAQNATLSDDNTL